VGEGGHDGEVDKGVGGKGGVGVMGDKECAVDMIPIGPYFSACNNWR